MTGDKLCNIDLTQIGNESDDDDIGKLRESYAKYTPMLFYPFKYLRDLRYRSTF